VKIAQNLTSAKILLEEQKLCLNSLDISDAIAIGEIAKFLGLESNLPIAIQVRLDNWIVYHVSLPGSKPENHDWISRKARVVLLKNHSTLFERVLAQEQGINWFEDHKLSETEYAIHGGALPLITSEGLLLGILIISGLSQIQDHLFGVKVLTDFYLTKRNQFD
jgi:uncharacterized protein (UPF0303 family)